MIERSSLKSCSGGEVELWKRGIGRDVGTLKRGSDKVMGVLEES